jgi:O-antigen/teichoic acid export membrane protein
LEAEGRSSVIRMRPGRGRGSLQRNVTWALVGNVGYTVFQWGILVCIAKLGNASDVGAFALGLAVTAPVITLANLHLRVLEATDARGDYPFPVYFALRLLTTSLALAVIAVIALAWGYRGAPLALILAVGLAKAFEAVSDVVFGLLQESENLRRVALSMLSKGVLSVIAIGGVLALGGNIVVATMTMALCWMVLLVSYDLPAASRLSSIRPTADPRALKSLAWMAAPMGCVGALGSLTANVPRYAIEGNLGPTALGHFAAIAYLFVAGGQPMMALGAAVTPRLARSFVTDLGAYRQLTRKTVLTAAALGLLAVAVAAIAGPLVLAVAYAPEYAQEAPALEWMAVAAGIGFAAKALAAAVTAARRLSVQLPIAITSLAVAALASEMLVPRWGLVGAAFAVLATEATRLICLGAIYVHAVSSAASEQCSRVPREHIASVG